MIALLAYIAFSVTLFNVALFWFNLWLWKDARRERREGSTASSRPTLSPDLKQKAASSRKLHRYLNGFGEHHSFGPRV
jgi:hypothetical protein